MAKFTVTGLDDVMEAMLRLYTKMQSVCWIGVVHNRPTIRVNQ